MRTTAALLLLVTVYAVLCSVYVSKTPYRTAGVLRHQGGAMVPDIGAPDERQHANYVKHVMDGKGFPMLKPGSPDLIETYQSHQPPLYYVLATGWARLTHADPTDESTGRRIRYLSLLLGAMTLLGVFYAAKWGLDREDVALAAVAFTGLMPMFVALNAAVSNDPLLYLICAWTMALCARGARFGWDMKLAILCGVCVGLGLITKTIALALLPMVLVSLIASRKWSDHKPRFSSICVALVLPVLIGMPWMARNQNLYGDPFAIKAFTVAFVGSPQPQHVAIPALVGAGDPTYLEAVDRVVRSDPDLQPREIVDKVYSEVGMSGRAQSEYWFNWVGWWTARSFVGVLGYMDVFLLDGKDLVASDTAYRLIIAVLALLTVASITSLRGGHDNPSKAVLLTNFVLFLVVVLFFVRFNMQYFQGQARYLYPAVCPISIGLGMGVCHVLKRHKQWAWAFAAGLLLAVQVLAMMALSDRFGPT